MGLLWRQKAGGSLKNCSCEKGAKKCRIEREQVMRLCMGVADYNAGIASHAPLITPSGPIFLLLYIVMTPKLGNTFFEILTLASSLPRLWTTFVSRRSDSIAVLAHARR